ncbi:hypothetical protein A5N15_02940 [Rothia kristinae]|uniref:Uncharacterized protein n=1 Tax=Rothia kristinae TaxID=37923 RepID=A0A657IVD7_9MICC|nr:hypothetical protein A5N15_02940 [Rothia kristinae]
MRDPHGRQAELVGEHGVGDRPAQIRLDGGLPTHGLGDRDLGRAHHGGSGIQPSGGNRFMSAHRDAADAALAQDPLGLRGEVGDVRATT